MDLPFENAKKKNGPLQRVRFLVQKILLSSLPSHPPNTHTRMATDTLLPYDASPEFGSHF